MKEPFPGLSPDEVHAAVARMWLIVGGVVPLPRWEPECPMCGAGGSTCLGEVQIGRIGYGHSPDRGVPHRADVDFKCTCCSYHWQHGVAITGEVWERAIKTFGSQSVPWRALKKWLDRYEAQCAATASSGTG
jgi:hypothetical protein